MAVKGVGIFINIKPIEDTGSDDYISAGSGLYKLPRTWGSGRKYPGENNSLYIDAGDTVTLTQDHTCNNLNLNTTSDVIRLNLQTYVLNFYGKIRGYTGTAPGTNSGSSAGTTGWITAGSGGKLKAVGTTRNITNSGEWGSNTNLVGFEFEFALDSGQTGSLTTNFRAGDVTISSGIVNLNGATLRVSGTSATTPGLGTFVCQSGAKLLATAVFSNCVIIQNNFTTQGRLASVTFDSGSELELLTSASIIATTAFTFNGKLVMSLGGAQSMPTKGTDAGAVDLNSFYEIELKTSGAKSLSYNTTVTGKLTLGNTATLNLNSLTLTYGASADLEYTITRATADAEFPNTTDTSLMPRNLIIPDGVTVTLNSNKNIRGTVQKPGSGTGVLDLNGFTLTENYV